MSPIDARRLVLVGLLATATFGVLACDVPSSGPSFETDTGVSSPVVVNKTFSLLGGEKSQHDPLIDTTTSQFDSLFVVSDADQSISIEEEISSFDFGSLDQVLDEATAGLGTEASLSQEVFRGSGLATQNVAAQFSQENSVPPPTSSATTTEPAESVAIPFPASLLDVPDVEAADIKADRVKRVTLTDESSYDGPTYSGTVNQITFTLRNKGAGSATLTDGTGNPPEIQLTDQYGTVVAERSFGATIPPGESESVDVDVKSQVLGDESEIALTVAGNDPTEDELDIELSPLRYRRALLDGVSAVGITASNNLSTRDGSGATQFAGIEARNGTLTMEVENQFAFPIEINDLSLTNDLQNSALPDSFPALNVSETAGSIAPGDTETFTVDLTGRGLADSIDVQFDGGLADTYTPDTLTVAASDRLTVSAGGDLTVGALYFWPIGEQVSAAGQVGFSTSRVRFDQPEDFVELSGGTLALDNLVSEPQVGFESFTLAFPDLRREPYETKDQLTIDASIGATTDPSIADVDLSDVRISPTNNQVDYTLEGTLEEIPPSEQGADNLRILRYDDRIEGDVSIDGLDVRAVDAGVQEFSVDVTTDANGDGRLDLENSQEAGQASFGSFDGLSDSIDDLELTGAQLTLRTKTDVGTDLQLYAALQGRGGEGPTFLAGTDSEKRVTATSALGDDLYDGGSPIAKEDLIQFGIEAAPSNDPVTRRVQLTQQNSTVDEVLNAFPSSLRFVAQARLTGDEEGRIHLRRPLTFETGLRAAVPVQIRGDFGLRDTIEADFSALRDVTDPTNDVSVSSAQLRLRYTNAVPLGAEVKLTVLDQGQAELLTLPGGDDVLRVKPSPKADDGTADGSRTGTTVLDLSVEQLRALADGRRLALHLAMDQAEAGGAATLRANDTIQLALEAEVETSVSVNN